MSPISPPIEMPKVTHVWIETTPKTYVIPPMRLLPTRLRPYESWETWVYFDQLPPIEVDGVYKLGSREAVDR